MAKPMDTLKRFYFNIIIIISDRVINDFIDYIILKPMTISNQNNIMLKIHTTEVALISYMLNLHKIKL